MALEKLKSIFQPKGFGDDLGLDDFDPNKLPGQSKLQNKKSIYGFGDDLGLIDIDA